MKLLIEPIDTGFTESLPDMRSYFWSDYLILNMLVWSDPIFRPHFPSSCQARNPEISFFISVNSSVAGLILGFFWHDRRLVAFVPADSALSV